MSHQPVILIEVQGKKVLLWVDHELIQEFKKNVFWGGKPLEIATAIEKSFITIGVFPKMETPELI